MKIDLDSFIHYSKAIAIFFVLLAHCCIWNGDSQIGKYLSLFLRNLGTMGVAIFFVVSGFLFDYSKSRKCKFLDFSLKKIKRICIPWFFSAVCFFAYMYSRHNTDALVLLQNILGIHSFYWYLAITMELYFIYYFIYKCKSTYKIVVFMGILSLYYPVISFFNDNALVDFPLNPIRWFYFFSIGICGSYLYQNKKDFNFYSFFTYAIIGLFALSLIFLCKKNITLVYKSFLYIPIATLGIISIMTIVHRLARSPKKSFIKVGKYSFGIYLYQMFPWTGLLVAVANRLDLPILILFNPFICLIICVLELDFFLYIFNKIKKDHYANYVLGIPFSGEKGLKKNAIPT